MNREADIPLRAEDALFLYAQSPLLCQQAGAVLLLEPATADAGDFRAALGQRAGAVPALHRRLVPAPTPWRRPRWATDDNTDVGRRSIMPGFRAVYRSPAVASSRFG